MLGIVTNQVSNMLFEKQKKEKKKKLAAAAKLKKKRNGYTKWQMQSNLQVGLSALVAQLKNN